MKRIRAVMVFLLALAYTGQALAGLVLPCANMALAGAAQDMADMPSMDHAGHRMPADSSETSAQAPADCCGAGLCVMSHCQSAAALPLHYFGGAWSFPASYPPGADAANPLHAVASLYRPPISR